MHLVLPGRGEPQPNSACQLTVSRAARPCAPEAQHAPRAHSTESKVPASNCRQLIPPSSLTSLPDGPTATTVRSVPGRNAEPDRYPPGACPAGTSDQVRPPSLVQEAASTATSGVRKSPPTATPCSGSRNASEKIPAAAPLAIGESVTVQCTPPSVLRNTRGRSPPPVANHAGIPAFGTTAQERPPSPVARIRNFPPTGSLSAIPRFASKKSRQS